MREFDSFGGFARFLMRAGMEAHKANEKGLKTAADIIQKEAKAEIAHYQEAAGPFQAWPDLADSTVTEKMRLGYASEDDHKPLLRTGELRDSIEVRVRHDEGAVGSDDPIAVYQELGTPNAAHPIPARSFLGGAAFRKSEEAAKAYATTVVGAIVGRLIDRSGGE